jgi:hypothetical protein
MYRSLRLLATLAIFGISSVAMAEQIDNPEYAQWSKYKAGTFITMQQSSEMLGMAAMPGMPAGMNMADMMAKISMTTKLTEVKPDAVTLEVTTTTTQMGRTSDNKTSRVVPAKIEKPVATAPATGPSVQAEVKDLKEGTETLEIKGNKIATITREYSTSIAAPAGGTGRTTRGGIPATAPAQINAHVKVWSSSEIPGGTVKTETTTTMDQMGDIKVTMSVVDYSVTK